MVIEMFKKTKSKGNVNSGSKESLDGSGNLTSSSESLCASRDRLFESTVSLYRTTQFELNFLGMIQDVNQGGRQARDPDVQLIDKVEEAQLEGKLRLVPKEEDLITLFISKYGVKVMDKSKREMLQRHPLHTVAQIVYYTDSFFKSNLALKIGQVGRTVYDCYVFQCHSENQAQTICQNLKEVFDIISSHTP